MRRLIVLVVALGLAAACGGGHSSSGSPSTAASSSGVVPTAPGGRPAGFSTAGVVIRRADGSICRLCTFVARTQQEQEQGLMAVTDLGGYDGMIFEFDPAVPQQFWMKNTVMPLTAAWFAADGSFIAAFDMPPCPAGTARCPSYGPPSATAHVLEVPQGALTTLGIGDGSKVESVDGPCRPATS